MNKFETFKHYYENTIREYHYRIKTVIEADDEMMGKLERVLQKYDLRDIEKPMKTMMQCHPIDFKDVPHGEVWIIDIVTGLPVSSFIMREEIRNALGINENFLVVRGENDPGSIESEKENALWQINDEAEKKDLTPGSLLSTDSLYMDGEQTMDGKKLYGDEYNSKLTDYLASVAKSRKNMEIKPSAPLFDFVYVADKETPEDFNAEFDTPKPKPWWEALEEPNMDEELVSHIGKPGNLDNDNTKYTRVFVDKNGKKVELSAEANGIRKGK